MFGPDHLLFGLEHFIFGLVVPLIDLVLDHLLFGQTHLLIGLGPRRMILNARYHVLICRKNL